MANRQIHELSQAGPLSTDDEVIVSTGADLTRRTALSALPFRSDRAEAVDRTFTDKLGEGLSVKDFGAVGDGVADDSAAFQAAVDSEYKIIVPPGIYRLETTIQIKPRRTILGAGRDVTEILAIAPMAFVFNRNEGANKIDAFSAEDWNRSALENLSIRMTTGGIRATGHEFRAIGLNFYGGYASTQADPDGWCIDMVDANECRISNIGAGYGGGTGHAMNTNGIRWRAQTPGVNYGDSLIDEVSLKLGAANTVAILLQGFGGSADNDPKVMNNMVLQRIQVNAPQAGSGFTPLPGSTGIKLWNASRICLIDCDVEVLDVAFEEYSQSEGGNSGACSANTFIGCIAHYSSTNYKDSNAEFTRSVIQRNFFGCDNVAPLPTGIIPDDQGRCQDGDAFLQGAWLFNLFGEPSVQLRSRDKDVLLITGDHKGDAQADADGHPRQTNPYFGFLLELTSNQSAKLTRPVAFDAVDPDDPANLLKDVRIEIGNGEGDMRGELARIQLNDPVTFSPRVTQPVRPRDGMMHYATAATALPETGDWYMGPGLYGRINNGEYPAIAAQRGAVPERERNTDFTVSAADFGKIIRVNNGGDKTVTIPAGLVPAGHGGRRMWIIRQGSGAVSFVSEGVTFRSANNQLSIARQYQMVEVLITSADEAYLSHIMPDSRETFDAPMHWTNGNLVVPSNYLGKLVRVGAAAQAYLEIPTGLVPDGLQGVSLKVMKAGQGDVEIRAGTDMTLISPSGTNPYLITQTGKAVTLMISAATEANQGNHIYIAD